MNETITEGVGVMKKILVVTAVMLMAFSAHLAARPDDVNGFQKYMGKLNLTEAQKKDVDKVRFDMEKQAIAQRAKLATARVDLRQLLKADNPDRSAIEKKLKEIADLGVGQHMLRLDAWFAINKLLTPEQQKTWKQVLENAPAMRRNMMNRWGGRQRTAPMMRPGRPASN
jgi:Spy/CpxP family protein refolding chaperone